MDKYLCDDSDILSSPEKRSGVEERWVSFQPYLLSKGYRLRSRYQPDWVPSWRGTNMRPTYCEDSIDSMPVRVLDAIRIEDEQQVMIKMVLPLQESREGKEELAILQYFSFPPLKADPSNHVVPCLDSFPIPGAESGHFVVMPLLGRSTEPPFHNLAEVHEFLQQLFEGLSFMHRNDVAHRDIALSNVMMDSRPLYDEPFHPVRQKFSMDIQRIIRPQYLRSEKRIRYYFIDLGYAKWFRDPNVPRMTTGKQARERAPEQKRGQPYNPFLADIYQLGMMLRQDIIPRINNLEFLNPLAVEMTRVDPMARPSLEKAQYGMSSAFLGLHGWRYRWPIMPNDPGFGTQLIYVLWGVTSEVKFWLSKMLQLLFRRSL